MILLGIKNNEKVSDAVSTLRIVIVDLMKFLLSMMGHLTALTKR